MSGNVGNMSGKAPNFQVHMSSRKAIERGTCRRL